MDQYNPGRWYWIVGNRPDVVFSSSAGAYLDTTDTDYQAWLADGNIASTIITDGELADVLARAGLEGPVVLSVDPSDWGWVDPISIVNAAKAAGCVITSTQYPELDAHYQVGSPAMDSAQIYINAHQELPNVGAPMPWPAYDKTVTFNDTAGFSVVYQGISDYWTAWKTWAQTGGTAPAWGGWDVAVRKARRAVEV